MESVAVINAEWKFSSLTVPQRTHGEAWLPTNPCGEHWEALSPDACRYRFTTWGTQFDNPYLNLLIICNNRVAWMQKSPRWLPVTLDSTKLKILERNCRHLLQVQQPSEETFVSPSPSIRCWSRDTFTSPCKLGLNDITSDAQPVTRALQH